MYESMLTAVVLELLAKQQAHASILGSAKAYTRDEMEKYYSRIGSRMWEGSPRKRWLWYERPLREKGLI